jgi:hypothetical protein
MAAPMHLHDIETPCEAVGCPLYDPRAWRCPCGSPVMLADTEGDPRGPCCADCAGEREAS